MVSILSSRPYCPPLKYRWQIKISDQIRHAFLASQVCSGYVAKYVGLHVVTLLIGCLYLSGMLQGFLSRTNTEKRHCMMKLDYVFRIIHVSSEHIWKGLCDHLKRTRIFTLTSYDFCISTLMILKLEMTIFVVVQLLSRWTSSQSNSTAKVPFWSWKCQCTQWLSCGWYSRVYRSVGNQWSGSRGDESQNVLAQNW